MAVSRCISLPSLILTAHLNARVGSLTFGRHPPLFSGGFVAEAWGWPWVFRLLAIVVGVIGVLMLLFTRESYAPVILRRRAAMRRRQQQQQQVSARSAGDGGMPDLRSKLDEGPGAADYFRQGIFRPCKILLSSPVASICAVHIAVSQP